MRLSGEEREQLEALIRKGKSAAQRLLPRDAVNVATIKKQPQGSWGCKVGGSSDVARLVNAPIINEAGS